VGSKVLRRWVFAAVAVVGLAGCTGDVHDALGARVAIGKLADRREARLDVVSGATAIVVRAAVLNDRLFQAWTPDASRVAPVATIDGDTVRMSLRDTGDAGPAELHVELNADVTWRIRLDGGTTEQSVDLGAGRLSSLDFGAGSSRIDAVLPPPRGTVPVRMTGGASIFDLRLPAGIPARVQLAAGAGQASIDGTVHNGVAGGTVLSTPDWEASADRYDLNLVAGVSALNLLRGEGEG
jgi:hypothetical protein